jgi:hypothetical protein
MLNTPPAVTDSDKLRVVADEVISGRRSGRIPSDIAALPLARRASLRDALYELAADVEAEPGPIEVAPVKPAQSKYTVEESRDVLYLLRVAVG